MGYYIDNTGNILQAEVANLVKNHNAEIINRPTEFVDNLVCVVDNGMFCAIGYAYSKEEMDEFLYPDGRAKQWLIVPDAAKLSGYKK